MCQESSGGHLELWLPGVAWVNLEMETLASNLEWTFDIRPTQLLDQIMPRHLQIQKSPTSISPYARRGSVIPAAGTPRVSSLARIPSTSTPRVVSSSRPPATASSRVPPTPADSPVQARPKPYNVPDTMSVDGDDSMTRANRHCSDVYLYFDEPLPSTDLTKGDDTKCYPCLHCGVVLSITGRPNSNLHKHRRRCVGLALAWFNHSPGSITPEEDPIAAAARKKDLRNLLVGVIISKNLPFSIFEGDIMQKALRAICPSFYWPSRMAVKADSEALFLDLEQKLIDEISRVPGSISTATDCWTSADFSHTYMAINGFFFNASGKFCRRLLAFKTLEGKHTGENLAKVYWKALDHVGAVRNHFSVTGDNASSNRSMVKLLSDQYATIGIHWPFESRFHGCMCHVINLVAKDYLDGMGELTDADLEAFETLGLADPPTFFQPDELPDADNDIRIDATSHRETEIDKSLEGNGPTQDAFDITQSTYEDIINTLDVNPQDAVELITQQGLYRAGRG